MHRINVLAFGSQNFNTSLEELKDYLNFKIKFAKNEFNAQIFDEHDVLLIHEDFFKNVDSTTNELLKKSNKIKVLVYNSVNHYTNFFTEKLNLPITIKELNQSIQKSIIKKNYSNNSSIKIKDYILDKNEKKLIKKLNNIILTEKEIQLLELFLHNTRPITKDKILDEVWKYSADADTHTVETHIYRLRKKIKSEFSDENFILNNKNGYSL